MTRIILPILLILSLIHAKRTVIHSDDAPVAIGPYS